jgi:site-specific recombinase XerD
MLEKGSGHKKPAVFYTLQHSFATHLIYGDFHDIQEETGDRL